MRKRLRIIALAILISILPMSLSYAASEQASDINFNTVTQRECKNSIEKVVNAINKGDEVGLRECLQYFTTSAYSELQDYVERTGGLGGELVSKVVVDYVDVPYSDTGDVVIMANCIVEYANQSYNKAYLFEFHVNSNGHIYGYNLWQY